MPIATIVTRGYGTFGSLGEIALRGYLTDSTAISASVSGIAFTETEILNGGESIVITLTNDTWHANLGDDNAITDAFIAGFDSDGAEAGGWNNTVRDAALAFGDITRDSDTQVTVLLPVVGAYAIDANETVTVTLDATTLVTSSSDVTASPTIAISYVDEGDGGTDPAPEEIVGGAHAGWNQGDRAKRKRDQKRRDDEEFLEIIAIAMPEIMKYLE